jgi:hypothetical protein
VSRPPFALLAAAALALIERGARADEPPVTIAPADGIVTLHVDAPQPVTLERRHGARSAWEHVCAAPCDQRLSVNDQYRFVGDGLNASPPFMLATDSGDAIAVSVRPAQHRRYVIAVWALASGVVTGVAGAIMVIGDDGLAGNDHTGWFTVGIISVIAGGAAAVVGGAIAIHNAHTGVEGAVAKEPSASAARGSSVAGARAPAWYASQTSAAPALAPPALVVPLLRGAF